MKYSILLLAFIALPCNASQFSKAEATEEIAFQILNVIDIGQTLDIKHHPNIHEGRLFESGGSAEIIGEHPSDAQVVGWLAVEGAAHYAISRYMIRHDAPKWLVHAWQAVTIGMKANCIQSNYHLGLKISF